MVIRLDRGHGGQDLSAQFTAFIEQSNLHNQEMRQIMMGMSSLVSQATMGGYGRQDVSRQAQASSTALQAANAGPSLAGGRRMVDGANPTAGQTNSAAMRGAAPPPASPGAPAPIGGGGGAPGRPPAGPPVGGTTSGGGGGGGGPVQPVGGGAPAGGGEQPPGSPGGAGGAGGSMTAGMPTTSGGGLSNSLMDKVKQFVPGASMINAGVQFYRAENEKNLWYLRNAGANTRKEQYSSRIGEEKFRAQNMLDFNEDQSRRLYKGIQTLGVHDQSDNKYYSQQGMADAAVKLKRRAGMNEEESLQVMAQSMAGGDNNIDRLANSLVKLNQVAAEAGVGVVALRESFMQNLMENQGMYGSAAGQKLAMGQAQTFAQWGTAASNVDMNGQIRNNTHNYAMSGSLGMTPAAMRAMAIKNPGAAAASQEKVTVQRLTEYLSSADPAAWSWLQQEVAASQTLLRAENGFNEALRIADGYMSRATMVDYNVWMTLVDLWSTEKYPDERSALAGFIMVMSDNGKSRQLGTSQSRAGTHDLAGKAMTGTDKGKIQSKYSYDSISQDMSGGLGLAPGASGTYLKGLRSGKIDNSGALADFMRKEGKYGGKQKIEVNTADGKRVMTVDEALKGGFEAQIISGDARMVGGGHAGKNISDIVAADTSAEARKNADASAAKKTKLGQDSKKYQEEHGTDDFLANGDKKKKKGDVLVTIGLSKQAEKLLRVTETSGPFSKDDASGDPRHERKRTAGIFD